jgi:hypothetical protein
MASGKKKNADSGNSRIVVNPKLKDHRNDPFFVKKAETSRKTVEKYGLPTHFPTGKK